MNLDMAAFQQTFFEEAVDILSEMEAALLRLSQMPDDPELLNTIFRCAHSIKGGSSSFGLNELADFTHGLETLLDRLRNGQARADGMTVQLLLASMDQLKALLSAARGEIDAPPDSAPLIFQIEEAIDLCGVSEEVWDEDSLREEIARMLAAQEQSDGAQQTSTVESTQDIARSYRLQFTPGPELLRRGADPAELLAQLHDAGEIDSIRCDASRLPALEALDPEASYLSWAVDFRSQWDTDRLMALFESVRDTGELILNERAAGAADTRADGESRTVVPTAERTEHADTPCAAVTLASAESPRTLKAAPADSFPALVPVQAGATQNTPASKSDSHTLRVSADKVDKLIDLVGELVINQSMLNEVVTHFVPGRLPRLIEAVEDMQRACRELQERVMAIRMLPIKHAFGRFPRLVHDLAAACGKKVELKMSGEDTELDKSVVEAIADPLTHLIRNSIDHGLETPDERVTAGKLETGTITLHACQEGGDIMVEVLDNGRGLNRDGILRKAIERGLFAPDEQPSDETVYDCIFHPGFSTADQITEVSGRGVGMDIVRRSVQALSGSITMISTPGQGTRFRVRLPLTMAILEGLSLSVGKEIYILPLTSIVESIKPADGDIRLIAGNAEAVMVRGEVIPILRLYQVFGAQSFIADPTQAVLVIIENNGRQCALLVDALIGQSQVVIKSLEVNYRKVDGVAGATILGDGSVALILDVPGLMRFKQSAGPNCAAAA